MDCCVDEYQPNEKVLKIELEVIGNKTYSKKKNLLLYQKKPIDKNLTQIEKQDLIL
jgi:hypothetical protein